MFQVCQCFVFCALLEFALVNYASRSDMQRDRARERNERARRQWELENADLLQQANATGATPTSQGGLVGNNGPTMNHIGSSDPLDGIPGYTLVRHISCNCTRTSSKWRRRPLQKHLPFLSEETFEKYMNDF